MLTPTSVGVRRIESASVAPELIRLPSVRGTSFEAPVVPEVESKSTTSSRPHNSIVDFAASGLGSTGGKVPKGGSTFTKPPSRCSTERSSTRWQPEACVAWAALAMCFDPSSTSRQCAWVRLNVTAIPSAGSSGDSGTAQYLLIVDKSISTAEGPFGKTIATRLPGPMPQASSCTPRCICCSICVRVHIHVRECSDRSSRSDKLLAFCVRVTHTLGAAWLATSPKTCGSILTGIELASIVGGAFVTPCGKGMASCL